MTGRNPRDDAVIPLDGSWPWQSELGDDESGTPAGFGSVTEAQTAHDELAAMWDLLGEPERRAFLQWFRELGPEQWPFSQADAEDLKRALQSLL